MPLEVSDGADADAIRLQVESLQGNGWDLVDNNMLKKTYCFATYTKVMDFHTVIGVRSKSTNHHPTMTTDYNSLTVQWTTHEPRGLSEKDIKMAKYSDEVASEIKTVDPSQAPRCGSRRSGL
ncbi:transcriptional coactivator/pterin dehydratase [Pyrenochaeta sp. DS3sAY3a]|nr:transcriptional coactivator/pterin dehydratase [Pyrenochaeta sp. DS3sAY3a]